MNPPRSAFGAAPFRGHRRWPGKAGSTAVIWLRRLGAEWVSPGGAHAVAIHTAGVGQPAIDAGHGPLRRKGLGYRGVIPIGYRVAPTSA